jgi:hypothetical protein
MKNTKGLAIAAAAAALFASKVTLAGSHEGGTEAKKVKCEGVNECRGKGECGGATHDCAGKNECKGKGWVEMSAAECKAKGGKVKED